MRAEKHRESLKEVLDEIEAAIEDSGGLISHQRRLAMMLSVGVTDLIEVYFHEIGIMKPGARIKHSWLKRKSFREKLKNQITGDIDRIPNLDKVIKRARKIEKRRNDMAYGSPLDDEKLLKENIDIFLEIRDIIEERIGDIFEP